MKLTDAKAKAAKPRDKQFKLSDGAGLHLLVMPSGSKYWRLKYRFGGKEKTLAIGVYPVVTLKAAREPTLDAKRQLALGIDPSQKRREDKIRRQAGPGTFGELAKHWADQHLANASDSHRERTLGIINNHLMPPLHRRPLSEITTPELSAVIEGILSKGLINTAHRARGIFSQIASKAALHGLVTHDVSTPLKGNLPKADVRHSAAFTDKDDVGRLMVAIHAFEGSPIVAAALKFSPLTMARPGEIRHAEWSEFNVDEALWSIPAAKMKAKSDHLVPLPDQAITILENIRPLTGRGRYVFPSARGQGRPMSENAVRVALRTLGFTNDQMTAHGFRAMGRTLLDEIPEIRTRLEVIEMQLAHTVKDPLGNAYNRVQYIDERREMLQKWADYLNWLRLITEQPNVVVGGFKNRGRI